MSVEEAAESGYLKRALDKARPDFASAVREAFRLEHGCGDDKAIAAVIGRTRGRVSQILGNPGQLSRATVEHVASHVSSPRLRQEIFDSWNAASAAPPPAAASAANAKACVLVRDLASSDRPEDALRVARERLASRASGPERRLLFIQAIGLCFRLDLPGDATELARDLYRWGEDEGFRERMAEGLALCARAMRRAGLPAQQVLEARASVFSLLASLPKRAGLAAECARFARDTVESEHAADVLRQHEAAGGQEAILAKLLVIARRRCREATAGNSLARAKQLEARILLGLGNPFKAEETLEEAFRAGGEDASAGITCGPFVGKIMLARGLREEAGHHFRRLSDACEVRRFPYVRRLAQSEIARLSRPGH